MPRPKIAILYAESADLMEWNSEQASQLSKMTCEMPDADGTMMRRSVGIPLLDE
jgi:hypothetical protein